MAKKTAFIGFLATLALGGVLVSCHDDMGSSSKVGVGGIAPTVDLNTAVTSSKKHRVPLR